MKMVPVPFNLLSEPWIPVHRADGNRDHITPWQLTELENPIVALDTPRADFNGALIQFLIGLVQTTFAPQDEDDWFEYFEQPPTPEKLKATFELYRDAFNLDGDDQRFMQDQDPLEGQKPLPITALLIDTAGSETHFVKDLPQKGISPSMAATALFTLQTNAPTGGRGYRTSLRGGGPLTTLVVCTPDQTNPRPASLWQTVWLNVLEKSAFDSPHNRPEDIFPWLAPTRVSDKNGRVTVPEDVSPLQMFWGMPRRIRLDFDDLESGDCGLSGETGRLLVRQYRTKNYGTDYPAETWRHTLSPHVADAKQTLPVHPRGSINYRHWLGLAQSLTEKSKQRVPARIVSEFYGSRESELRRGGFRFSLWAFGYDLDNMKPRCWYEATLPLFRMKTSEDRDALESAADSMVKAAGEFLGNLRSCLKDAWFAAGDPRRKGADTGFIDNAFWLDTENQFYGHLHALADNPEEGAPRKSQLHGWHAYLNEYTRRSFDRWANTELIGDQTHPRRIAEAQRNLFRFNYKKSIKRLLDLPVKEKAAA